MARSEFDPSNPDSTNLPRGGLDRFLGPGAARSSNMPEDLVDGEVEEDAPEDNEMSHEALSPDEAARMLEGMQETETEETEETEETDEIEPPATEEQARREER